MTGHFAEAHSSHARHLTAQLRRHAWQSGWPADVARHLHVNHDAGAYYVEYPSHVDTKVQTLEFGSPSQPPSSVIHRFMNRIDHHSGHIDAALTPHLERMEVFF